MIMRTAVTALVMVLAGCLASAEVFVEPQAPERSLGIVTNAEFDAGGMSYAHGWRPLPGSFRMHRRQNEACAWSLFLGLREEGEAGVMQTVHLPPRRSLSLRVLATAHTDTGAAVVVTLVRASDGVILAEVVVDGIERGVLAQGFESGPGGPAQLMVRLVGGAGSMGLVDRVTIAPPVQARYARPPDYSGRDLLLAEGHGLRVDADFEPRLLPQAARMLQEAMEDRTGARTSQIGAGVFVSVSQPEAVEWPERESYHLRVSESGVTISAPAEEGAVWAMMTLIDLIRPEPDGGARLLAVDVQDRPALQWRIAVGQMGDINAARKAARLKLNMALVDYHDESCLATMDELRSIGLEPVLIIVADQTDDVTGAMQDAVTRLGAQFLLVTLPTAQVVDFARRHADRVTVLAHAGDAEPEAWPGEIIALLAADDEPERLSRWRGAGIRCVLGDLEPSAGMAVPLALERLAAGDGCLGSTIWLAGREAARTQQLADLAWRGMPAVD